MLKITITEINNTNEIKINLEALMLIEQAEDIVDNLLSLGSFENDQIIEEKLSEISTLLFNVQCSLSNKVELAELHGEF